MAAKSKIIKKLKNYTGKFRLLVKSQERDLKYGGWPVFFRKCHTLFLILPALLIACVVRMLRPFILIRLAPLCSDRIGSYCGFIDIYLCQRNAGMHRCKTLDFFYYTFPICNKQLDKMLSPHLNILRYHHLANIIYKIQLLLPGGINYEVPVTFIDIDGFRGNSSPNISFNSWEEHFGRKEIQKLGISKRDQFICFHARDSAYLNFIHPGNDFSYHNHRDVNINNFLSAAEELSSRGYYMVRMGALVNSPLNTKNPRIIDYASKHRTDFLDIYLPSKCKFFICAPCGISEIPQAFRRPVAWTNWIFPYQPLGLWNHYDLIIPKRYFLRKENRFLTFKEIFSSGLRKFTYQEFRNADIEVIENTADEILDLAIEMDERLKENWKVIKEDEALQQRFWHIFNSSTSFGENRARIGRNFLRKNEELLV